MRTALLLSLLAAAATAQSAAGSLAGLAEIQPGRSRRISSHHEEPLSNWDNRRVPPGKTHVLADIAGAGRITHVWMTFPVPDPSWIAKDGSAAHDELVLRMYWDGGEQPAVEAPLGDFFAAGFGVRRPVDSVPVVVEGGDAYNCYWQMPYRTRARIEVENQSDRPLIGFYYHVDYLELDELPAGTPYFCAQYRQEFPSKLGQEYLILDADGPGHYVGTVMSVRSRSPAWFGEGDEKFWIDGERQPSIWGTGTEDYFLCAWGLDECSTPYFGCTLRDGEHGGLGTRYCLYRWHVHDPVRFRRSLRLTIEHHGWISPDESAENEAGSHYEREDDFATVAFWYQVGQPRRFTTLPPLAERRLPEIDVIVGGEQLLASAKHSAGEAKLQRGRSWTGTGQLFFENEAADGFLECDFTVEREELRGLVLRVTKSFDYGAFRVLLDGEQVVARLDLYDPETTVREVQLGQRTLAPGRHTLRFECVGRNRAATDHFLGLDSVRLRERWNKKRPNLHTIWKEKTPDQKLPERR
ncbi:MAG: DUF2961 domain-containing protein [Planctomycetes bacterium]|nr:DUF2961 domain-containing protein [Planctomycetota bacterium]